MCFCHTCKYSHYFSEPSAAVHNEISRTQQQPIESPQHTTLQQNNSRPNHLEHSQPPNSQFNGEYPTRTNLNTSSVKGKSGYPQNHAEYPANNLQRQGTDTNSSSLKGKSGNPQNQIEYPANNLQMQGANMNSTSLKGNSGYPQNHVEHPTNNLQRQTTNMNNTSLKGNSGYPQKHSPVQSNQRTMVQSGAELRKSPTGRVH